MLKLLALFFNVLKQLKQPPCTCNVHTNARTHNRQTSITQSHTYRSEIGILNGIGVGWLRMATVKTSRLRFIRNCQYQTIQKCPACA